MSVMRNLAPAVAISAALYSGAFEIAKPHEPYRVHALSAEYETVIMDAFAAGKSYWKSQGVPLETQLQIIEGDQAVACLGIDSAHIDRAKSIAVSEYCPGNDRVVISDGFVDYLSGGYRAPERAISAILKFVVGHEQGHAVQQYTAGILPEGEQSLAYHAPLEVQADCYGGKYMSEVYPDDTATADVFFQLTSPMDVTHGLPIQRYGSYFQGAHAGNCEFGLQYGPYESVMAPGDISVLIDSTDG